jgi:hypothetical protein
VDPPLPPADQWQGRAVHKTLLEEWAYARLYRSNSERCLRQVAAPLQSPATTHLARRPDPMAALVNNAGGKHMFQVRSATSRWSWWASSRRAGEDKARQHFQLEPLEHFSDLCARPGEEPGPGTLHPTAACSISFGKAVALSTASRSRVPAADNTTQVTRSGKPPMVKPSKGPPQPISISSAWRRWREPRARAGRHLQRTGEAPRPLPPSRDEAGSSRERCQAELEVPDKQPGPQVVGHVFGACCDLLDL